MKKLYVGNLPFSTSDDELRELAQQHGTVQECIVIKDRETGRSKGFGFVTFEESVDIDSIINSMDQSQLGGRGIRVSEAKSRT